MLLWVVQDNPIQFLHGPADSSGGFVHPHFLPHITGLGSVAFLAGIILLFTGVEVHAVHANELPNPSTQLPLSMLLASGIVFLLFLLGSLAVAAVLPASQISLTSGLMAAFETLLGKFQLAWLTPAVGVLIAFGAAGGVLSWVSGPSRGLLQTARSGEIPPIMARVNRNGVQRNILLLQAAIVSGLACIYFVMKNASVAFFVLSAMIITLYLLMYILMYLAAIKLRVTRPDLPRGYRVPGGVVGMCVVAGVGLLGVGFAFVVGFFPPTSLPIGSPTLYVCLVAGGLVAFTGLPMAIHAMKKPDWKRSIDD